MTLTKGEDNHNVCPRATGPLGHNSRIETFSRSWPKDVDISGKGADDHIGGDSADFPFLEDAPTSPASPTRRRVGCDNADTSEKGADDHIGLYVSMGSLASS